MTKAKIDPVTYTGRRNENPQLSIVVRSNKRMYNYILLNKACVNALHGKSNVTISFKGITKTTHISPAGNTQFVICSSKLAKTIAECVNFVPETEKLYVECTVTGIKKPVIVLDTIIIQQRNVPVKRIKI